MLVMLPALLQASPVQLQGLFLEPHEESKLWLWLSRLAFHLRRVSVWFQAKGMSMEEAETRKERSKKRMNKGDSAMIVGDFRMCWEWSTELAGIERYL